ncbi:hypothetical protein GJV26_02390 [Massilia dura]|uniref:Uncharacterized protein n=1 Tax=Pseudoduganella dura TaxID=321982 RepID=A0A6I3XCS5_9BURK|nr:hypothetical protein [Pseudoduganella dura]MUI11341.1 hypothetical protein [Pseudoduganella dura]GGX95526.1 hypothetical protein GCM10007386_28000 [Pseudoduganella dura]
MNTLNTGRRGTDLANPAHAWITTDTVREGILLQHTSNTVTAVEFLMARGIDNAIIRRVLNGAGLRRDDAEALAAVRDAKAVAY